MKEGETVTPRHLDVLDRIADTARNAIAESARRESLIVRSRRGVVKLSA